MRFSYVTSSRGGSSVRAPSGPRGARRSVSSARVVTPRSVSFAVRSEAIGEPPYGDCKLLHPARHPRASVRTEPAPRRRQRRLWSAPREPRVAGCRRRRRRARRRRRGSRRTAPRRWRRWCAPRRARRQRDARPRRAAGSAPPRPTGSTGSARRTARGRTETPARRRLGGAEGAAIRGLDVIGENARRGTGGRRRRSRSSRVFVHGTRLGDDRAENRLESRRAVLRGARDVQARQPAHGRGAGRWKLAAFGARERFRETLRQVRRQRVRDARRGVVQTPLECFSVDGARHPRIRKARKAGAPKTLRVGLERVRVPDERKLVVVDVARGRFGRGFGRLSSRRLILRVRRAQRRRDGLGVLRRHARL